MAPRRHPPQLLQPELLLLSLCIATSLALNETVTLINFKASLDNSDVPLQNWKASGVPCIGKTPQFKGVICTDDGKVWGLQLEGMGLSGTLNISLLLGLQNMRTISFMNNSFQGSLPDIKKLGALKNLYLSNNRFNGDIPDDAFDNMVWLKKVYLSHNQFTGPIPTSLTKLPKLLELRLDENKFHGEIPDFPQRGLQFVNVSNNHFEGAVPESLSKEDPRLLSGNAGLCGQPLTPCPKKKSKTLVVAIIVVVVGCALLLFFAVLIFLCRRRRRNPELPSQLGKISSMEKPKKGVFGQGHQMEQVSSENLSAGKKADHGKLVFVRNDREKFDLQDLLRASAEILGSGSFGSSYKAALLGGPVMVVKRYRQMNNLGREGFHEHMKRLGSLGHPNLLSLVSYFYKKEEKLLVSNFVQNGSLAHHLHGNRTPDTPALNWPTRLNIIKGVARGLAYLYNELPSIIVAHGHLKSTNVLLTHSFEPLLTDYCLLPVINRDHAVQYMVAYKSPEYSQHGRLSPKTDVWSLGILILEMITGKFPENYLTQNQGDGDADLAKWVNSVVREEWTGEVFDKELKGTKHAEGEMLKLLKIALGCCNKDVDRRWALNEAVARIEELKERDNDSDDFSSYASEGDVYSSRAMTEDDFSFSMNA